MEDEAPPSAEAALRPRAPVPWDLDRLPEKRLRQAYEGMGEFAERLREWGLTVPTCWHVVGHRVHQFAAVVWWYEKATRPRLTYPVPGLPLDTNPPKLRTDPAAHPRETAEWHGSPWGLAGMEAFWATKDCGQRCRVLGQDMEVPTLEASIRAHVLLNAARRPRRR